MNTRRPKRGAVAPAMRSGNAVVGAPSAVRSCVSVSSRMVELGPRIKDAQQRSNAKPAASKSSGGFWANQPGEGQHRFLLTLICAICGLNCSSQGKPEACRQNGIRDAAASGAHSESSGAGAKPIRVERREGSGSGPNRARNPVSAFCFPLSTFCQTTPAIQFLSGGGFLGSPLRTDTDCCGGFCGAGMAAEKSRQRTCHDRACGVVYTT